METLHESIRISLQSLALAAVPGLLCRRADGINILFHMLLTSYAANNPECEGMLLGKRGTQASPLCHICFVNRDDLNFNGVVDRRSLKDTLSSLLCYLKDTSSEAQGKMQQFPMISIAPVLNRFPFVRAETSVDLYLVFH